VVRPLTKTIFSEEAASACRCHFSDGVLSDTFSEVLSETLKHGKCQKRVPTLFTIMIEPLRGSRSAR
jgi:hypothetical protein